MLAYASSRTLLADKGLGLASWNCAVRGDLLFVLFVSLLLLRVLDILLKRTFCFVRVKVLNLNFLLLLLFDFMILDEDFGRDGLRATSFLLVRLLLFCN